MKFLLTAFLALPLFIYGQDFAPVHEWSIGAKAMMKSNVYGKEFKEATLVTA